MNAVDIDMSKGKCMVAVLRPLGLGLFNREARPYIREVLAQTDHNVYNRTWKAVTNMESRADLPRITCPTLLLLGDQDSMTRRQQAYMRANIPGARLAIIQNAHHGTNLDNPAQVEAEMERFWPGQPQNPPKHKKARPMCLQAGSLRLCK